MKKIIFVFLAVFLITACGDKEKSSDNDVVDDSDTTSVSDGNDELNADPDVTDDVLADEDEGDTSPDLDNDDSGDSVPDDIGAMIDIPAGPFMMGCSGGTYCSSSSSPVHEVTLSAYRIGKYEVTAGEYQKCIDAGNCNNNNEDELHYQIYVSTDEFSCNLGREDKQNDPVNCVSWYGAKVYCEWAGKRLPTEAEWEKAARGEDERLYPWGDEPSPSCEYAVIYEEKGHTYGCGKNSTWVVGSKEKGKSPYGLYDMSGNAEEWINDWYGEDYYETSPSEDPEGPVTGNWRVSRGGSWISFGDVYKLCTSGRNSGDPKGWSGLIGFRCAE